MQRCLKHKDSGTDNNVFKFSEKEKKQSMVRVALRSIKMIFLTAKLQLTLNILVSLVGKMLPIIAAMLWKNILEIISGASYSIADPKIIKSFILYGIIGGISVSFYYFSEVIDTLFRNVISIKMQSEIHKKAQKISVEYYESPELNDVIKRSQNAFAYGPAVGMNLSIIGLFSTIIALTASAGLLWSYDHSLVFMVVMIGAPYFFRMYINKSKLDFKMKSSSKRREADVYRSYFTDRKYVKETQVLGAKNLFLSKWIMTMKRVKNDELKTNIRAISIEAVIEILENIGYVAIIFLALRMIMSGTIDIAMFGAVIMLIGAFRSNVAQLIEQFSDIHEEIGEVRAGFQYLDIKEEERTVDKSVDLDRSVACINASYSYPFSDKKAISDVEFQVNKGEIVAIVGANGAGKSTIARLILGLYNPTEGKVEYDGVDISEILYHIVAKNTSAVFQDYNRYLLSIKENIGLGNIEKMQEADLIEEAAEKSGALSFIQKLQSGMETGLGKEYGGMDLSGGQWQQLALARGYFRDGNFVVLDEPSSALDPMKEAKMYEHFRELSRGKIGVIITHRLGAARLADRILLVDKGRIMEQGTHKELYSKKATYWKMYNSQASMYGEIEK